MKITKNLVVAVVVLVLGLTPTLFGCGGPDVVDKDISGTVSEENLTLGKTDGVSVTFSPMDIDAEAEVKVTKVELENTSEDPDATVTAYDVTCTGKHEFISLIEITIPYDAEKIESGENPADYVEAFYVNDETGVLEPIVYELDTEKNLAIITTDHLSEFAVFTYSKKYTRKTTISVNSAAYINMIGGDRETYKKVFEEVFANGGTPGDITLETGFNIANEALGISGNALTFVTEAMYSTELLGNFGNLFTGLGVAAAALQAAYDWKNWEKDDGLAFKTNLTKNVSYLTVSFVGSSAAKLASVGVFAIDYSLNKFGSEAWAGRNAVYQKAYNAYYTDMYRGGKLARTLYSRLLDEYKKHAGSPQSFDLSAATKKVVMDFAGEFWADDGNLPVYLQQVGITFSGYGGLNKNTIEETKNSYYVELMQTVMQPVFVSLRNKITNDIKLEYMKKLYAVKNEMNRRVPIIITESKENDDAEYKYANHQIRFAPLAPEADKTYWTGKLKNDATAKSYFTVIGYITSGIPTKLEIYAPDADLETAEPVEVIDFKFTLDMKELKIDIGSSPPTLDDLVGTWENRNNKLTLLNADANWDEMKQNLLAASEQATQELKEEYGCEEGIDLSPETIDQVESSLKAYIGTSQYMIFNIGKVNETTGKMTFVSFPDASEGQCDSTAGLTFEFTYDAGNMTVLYGSLIDFLKTSSQEGVDMGAVPFIPGSGKLTATFARNADGKKTIIIDGNLDYSMVDTGEEFPFRMYINYGIHGEK